MTTTSALLIFSSEMILRGKKTKPALRSIWHCGDSNRFLSILLSIRSIICKCFSLGLESLGTVYRISNRGRVHTRIKKEIERNLCAYSSPCLYRGGSSIGRNEERHGFAVASKAACARTSATSQRFLTIRINRNIWLLQSSFALMLEISSILRNVTLCRNPKLYFKARDKKQCARMLYE